MRHHRRGWPARASPSAGCPRRTSGAAVRRSMATKQRQQRRARANAPIVCGRGPALVGRLDDGPHEQQHPGGQGQRAGHVEAPAVERRGAVVRDTRGADGQQRERDRHGEQEGPAPAELGQQAAEHEAEREAAGPGRGVDAERPVALGPFRERRRDDRQARRGGEGRGRALEEARDDEQGAVVDEPAERRGDGEDARAR